MEPKSLRHCVCNLLKTDKGLQNTFLFWHEVPFFTVTVVTILHYLGGIKIVLFNGGCFALKSVTGRRIRRLTVARSINQTTGTAQAAILFGKQPQLCFGSNFY